jgi:SAM-dependent methyltransferase
MLPTNFETPMNKVEMIEGFKCYAPELAHANDGFSAQEFDRLYRLEEANFWYRSRNNLIKHFFKSTLGDKESKVCEIGCGTGYVLNGLTSFKNMTLSGSEIYVAGLKYARKRLPGADLFQADATELPFEEKYDAVGAFDVLEHIADDTKAMRSIYQTIKPGGYFIVTVPQYQWMWSVEDDIDCHKRRYSRRELKEKLRASGFDVQFASSFVFLLFPVVALQRFFSRIGKNKKAGSQLDGLDLPFFLNEIFYFLTQLDVLAIKVGINLPWGSSLVCIAKKI